MSGSDIKKLQLEIGGNLFELIEFSLSRKVRDQPVKGVYGVNVAKVREVVRMPRINPLASRIKGVAGIFELRGIPIPAVNLACALGDEDAPVRAEQQIIVTEFAQKRAGFIVDTTHRIRRIAWDKVLPPSGDNSSFINGMALVENNDFLFILDLERILLNLEMASLQGLNGAPQGAVPMMNPMLMGQMAMPHPGYFAQPMPPNYHQALEPSQDAPLILLAEDSPLIRQGVKYALHRAGYRVLEATNGADALTALERSLQGREDERISLLVTDVEMPRLDGLSLTRKIREHQALSELPVILHTSLSGQANQSAGVAVGANGYVIKNDFRTLMALIKECIGQDAFHSLSA